MKLQPIQLIFQILLIFTMETKYVRIAVEKFYILVKESFNLEQ